MKSLLLDTNILVYSKDSRSEFHLWVMSIVEDGRFDFYTTAKNLSEYYAVVTRGERPKATPHEALEDIRQFISIFNIIHSNQLSLQILEGLISENKPKGLRIHDYEIASIALSRDIRSIVTLNAKDFRLIENLEVVSPA